MSNEFYNNSSDPADHSDGDPAIIRAEHAAIALGFGKLPTMSGNGQKLVMVNAGASALKATEEVTEEMLSTTPGTSQATTSGSTVDFTDIPSWIRRFSILFKGVSADKATTLQFELGTSSGLETTGYNGNAYNGAGTTSSSGTYSPIAALAGAGDTIFGKVDFMLENLSTNNWVWSGSMLISGGTSLYSFCGGYKALSGALDRIHFLISSGAVFDAGSINITYGR